MKKERIKITPNIELNTKSDEILSKVDEMRKKETGEVITRASMVRICINEAYKKRASN